MHKKNYILLFCFLALGVSGCSQARESLGLEKDAPDEFAVVRHAPLEMPPGLALPPPRPGEPRPQESAPALQAKGALFGEAAVQAGGQPKSSAEAALLTKTGAGASDPNIRATLDAETDEAAQQNKPVVKRLLGLAGGKVKEEGSPIDARAEAERLRQQNLPAPIPPKPAGDKAE